MRRPLELIAICLSVAACFSPRYSPEGSACKDACPDDLRCVNGRCVRGEGEIDAGTDASTDASAVCPPGYVRNASTGSYYRVVNTPANVGIAIADCADDGARSHLVIPDNPVENNVLDALANEDSWLGISDAGMEGTWVTVLGGLQTYFQWGTDQPDGKEAENCAYIANGTWQDTSCLIAKPYVCECR